MKNDIPTAPAPRVSRAFEHVAAVLRSEGLVDDAVAGSGEQSRRPRAFGSDALKIGGKIFAMPVRGTLVIKLPRERVDVLLKSGAGSRHDPGHGRLMREWISLRSPDGDVAASWLELAREAREFVKGGSATTGRSPRKQ